MPLYPQSEGSWPITTSQIDSARVYRNEQPCADAIRKSGLPRASIFFTSKIPPRDMGYERAKSSIESTFKQTGLDYVDLYVKACSYHWLCMSPGKLANVNQIPYTCSLRWQGRPQWSVEGSCRSSESWKNPLYRRVELRRTSP